MNWMRLSPEDRYVYADSVWAMYETSYAAIGLIASGPEQLLAEYDAWWVLFDDDAQPRAFRVAKTTPWGIKLGLSGTDGTKDAKRALVAAVGDWMDEPGFYAEVSHRMEEIAIAAQAPVVCLDDARRVLGKPVEAVDALRYQRLIVGVGPVTKVMVGRPVGVEPTNFTLPRCLKQPMPVRGPLAGFFAGMESALADRLADDSSLMPWLDD